MDEMNLPEKENETPVNETVEGTVLEGNENFPKDKEPDKDLKSALAQKEHWRTKAEKAEAAKKELEGKVQNASGSQFNPLEIVKLSKVLGGFDESETDFILRNSDGTLDGIIKASKDDWVQAAITSRREKVAAEKSVPKPSSPTTQINREDIVKTMDSGDNAVAADVAKRIKALEAMQGGAGEGI